MTKKDDPFNEGKACDAVLGRIESLTGASRSGIAFPEKLGDKAPVDIFCKIGSLPYALEHTGIEPFEGHVNWRKTAERKTAPIIEKLKALIPEGDEYEILVPFHEFNALKGKPLELTQQAIVAEASKLAPSLVAKEAYTRNMPVSLPRSPQLQMDVTIRRFTPMPQLNRHVYIQPYVGDDTQQRRTERIKRAYQGHQPKLMAWKAKGARTVMILENSEGSLTNAERVATALTEVEKEYSKLPDEVYFVDSCHSKLWFVFAIRLGDQDYYTLSRAKKCLTEIDPASLQNITGN